MKNFFKGIGATIGYIVLYFVINLLVIFTGIIYLGINEGIKSVGDPGLSKSLPEMIESLIYDNAMLFTLIASIICLFVFWPVIILGISTNIFISNFISFLPIPESLIQEYAEATNLLGDDITVIQVLAVVIAAPILEEVLYRGLIMKSLQRGMPVIVALILQAIVFGLMHGQLLWICYATFLGVLLAVIKLKYKSLYPSILLHLAFNIANYILIPFYSIIPDNIYSDIMIFAIALIISVIMVRIIFIKTISNSPSFMENLDSSCQYPD